MLGCIIGMVVAIVVIALGVKLSIDKHGVLGAIFMFVGCIMMAGFVFGLIGLRL